MNFSARHIKGKYCLRNGGRINSKQAYDFKTILSNLLEKHKIGKKAQQYKIKFYNNEMQFELEGRTVRYNSKHQYTHKIKG